MDKINRLSQKLISEKRLKREEYKALIEGYSPELAAILRDEARREKHRIYGNKIFIRGLIEISNICKNDCLYCGIRRSNSSCERFRLEPERILSLCKKGYGLGFRTFVLQGGEDAYYSDERLCPLIESIKAEHPDCAVTLSLGERSPESYERLRAAGADRYLLRHETINPEHYKKLHPIEMSFENRQECLQALRRLGYQVGSGFMVGTPFQTTDDLAAELLFIEDFSPEMCGIGPFLPHSATPFAKHPKGSSELTCFLLSIIRIIKPEILLPATTALGTARQGGREQGILSGANVVMPNLSPEDTREKYELYDNKLSSGAESANGLQALKVNLQAIGEEIAIDRGDAAIKNQENKEELL